MKELLLDVHSINDNQDICPDHFAMEPVQAVVYKDHTLGTLGTAFGEPSIAILHGIVWKGGKHFNDGPILFVKENEYSPATREDFDTFNVQYNPHYLVAE